MIGQSDSVYGARRACDDIATRCGIGKAPAQAVAAARHDRLDCVRLGDQLVPHHRRNVPFRQLFHRAGGAERDGRHHVVGADAGDYRPADRRGGAVARRAARSVGKAQAVDRRADIGHGRGRRVDVVHRTADPVTPSRRCCCWRLGTFSLQLALVLYNAMLPALAPPEKTGRWSGWGWCAGYAGGLACLAVALFVFVLPEGRWLGLDPGRAEHIRATLPMTAAWLLLFSLPLLWLTP
jgi:hypothetical protein